MKPILQLHHGCYELSQTIFGGASKIALQVWALKIFEANVSMKMRVFSANVVVATSWSQIVDVEI